MRYILLILLGTLAFESYSATFNVRLVIQQGTLNLNGGATVDYFTYSESSTFQNNSDLFIWNTGDEVILKVVNQSTLDHGFAIEDYTDYGLILPGDSVEQTIQLINGGVFRYYDPMNWPYNSHIGLSGIIHIKDPTDTTPYFYWGLREHQESWNAMIAAMSFPPLTSYDPEHFTINGNHSPNVNSDVVARPTGSVGNEFRIVMVNHGFSIHSMHFHGYHLTTLVDSKNPAYTGRSKDTFPIHPGEHLVLSCTPDKPGEYPVHDHNLVAVTGGQEYATGMFVTLLIAP